MFSNRGWLLKAFVPLALFAALCGDAALRLGSRYPHFSRAQAALSEHAGRTLWVGPAQVVETGADYMVIEDRGSRLRLNSDARHATGTHLRARGVLQADGTFTPDAMQKVDHYAYKRGSIYGISAVVLLVFLRMFWKSFRPTRRGFEPRPEAPEPMPPPEEPPRG